MSLKPTPTIRLLLNCGLMAYYTDQKLTPKALDLNATDLWKFVSEFDVRNSTFKNPVLATVEYRKAGTEQVFTVSDMKASIKKLGIDHGDWIMFRIVEKQPTREGL